MALSTSTSPSLITVALLEEQRVLRESLKDLLEYHGFRVSPCCGDPRELFEGLSLTKADVVVVDLRHAPDDALESWRTVKHLSEWHPQTRLVILSGTREQADLERARQYGAAAFLSKDTLSSSDLIEALRRVHGGEEVFPVLSSVPSAERAPSPNEGLLGKLTPREVDVLRCISGGFDNLKIAACLEVSERTVRSHVSNLYKKLGAENRTQLALLGRELGLKPPAR